MSVNPQAYLKGLLYCISTYIESSEMTGIHLSSRLVKTTRKNSKGLKSDKEFKF